MAAEAVTTSTDLWIDAQRNYRLVETNDQDGGREIVRHGRDLAVGLRHGKMVRRPAQEPEPTRFLEEAVGAPWAAWETVRRFASVEAAAGQPDAFRLGRAKAPAPAVADESATTPLRKWRETVEVRSLEGEARVDRGTGALLAFRLKTSFATSRDGQPLEGEVTVSAQLDDIGRTDPIARPEAEELRPRQRTILEERALLGGLPGAKEAR